MIALYNTPWDHVNFLLYNGLSIINMQLLSAWQYSFIIQLLSANILYVKLILVYYRWFCGCVIPVLFRFQLQEKSLVQLS